MTSACALTHDIVSKLLGKYKLHGLGAKDLRSIRGFVILLCHQNFSLASK